MNPEAQIEFAKECMAAGEEQRAVAAFRRALELDPSSPYYLQELIRAYWQVGIREQLRPLVDFGLRVDPSNQVFQQFDLALKSQATTA